MKHVIIAGIIALCAVGQQVSAQDAKAKQVLDNVSKKVSTLKSLKANFTLKIASGKGKPEIKTGTFFMKGQKYHVVLAKQEIICDGKTVWTYMKDANEVQVSKYNPEEQTISPTKLFTNFYDKEYTYRYIGTKKVGAKDCDVVEMTPINKTKQLTKIELGIDKNGVISSGNVYQKNGSRVEYDVSGYTPNAPVTDAQFTFDPKQHPGVEVVDLR